jgi:hypothetical protein
MSTFKWLAFPLNSGKDELMKIRIAFLLLTVTLIVSVPQSYAQTRQDVGTKVLVPSSAGTGSFSSLLVVLNLDSQPNNVTITARHTDGSVIGTPITATIPVGGRFRSTNILGDMGAAPGGDVFGPITVESTNGRQLSAVSEVASAQGSAGFFPGVNVETAWTQGFIAEVVDTGDMGQPGTHRTNLGVNTVAGTAANVTITFHNDSGTQLGSTSTAVPGNGLAQINSVIRAAVGSSIVTGQDGYLKIVSDQPIVAWASKIENGLNDPSFQIGIAATSISQFAPASSQLPNNFIFVALGLTAPVVSILFRRRKKPSPAWTAA